MGREKEEKNSNKKKFSSLILTTSINFSDFLTFAGYKKINNISM